MGQLFASDKTACLGSQGKMKTDDVAAAQQLIEFHGLKWQIDTSENMMFETEHMTAKGVGQAGHLQPDMTASNNPEGLAKQLMTDQFAVGTAGTDGRVCSNNPPQQRDHQADNQLAYRMDRVTCRVFNNDTASLTRFLINVINTGKCYADQLKFRASFDYYS